MPIILITVFCLFSSLLLAENFEGLTYQHITTDIPQSIHILTIDPSKYVIAPVRALDEGIGREKVSSLAKRHKAIAAINGGFFHIDELYDGVSRGILKIQGEWFSLPFKTRGAIGWTNDYKIVLMDKVFVKGWVAIGEKTIQLDGINKERGDHETILYTSSFHKTTLTDPYGMEIIAENNIIKDVIKDRGSSVIPQNGFVLSLGKTATSTSYTLGQSISPSFEITPSGWDIAHHIVGGAPLLIHNGIVITDFSSEQVLEGFLQKRYARTAIGIDKNKHWIFVVVDGKRPGVSMGMTISELAEFMRSLGCIHALNLDGGSSSTMVIEGKVVNQPYGDLDQGDKKDSEKCVSDAIAIIRK